MVLAKRYFQSFENYFWEWDKDEDFNEEYNLISIPGSSTIAYKSYILEVIEDLSSQGVPPFGSLLLTIIATNTNAKLAIDKVHKLLFKSQFSDEGALASESLEFLNKLIDLPEPYKRGEKRIQIFQTIFEGCHKITSSDKTKRILNYILECPEVLNECATKKPANQGHFYNDLRILTILNQKFADSNAIVKEMVKVTGIDIPDTTAIETVPDTDLINALLNDNRTFYIGALIKRIWSGMSQMIFHFDSGVQPLGGMADIASKGTIERLLTSEFAYDDEVFLSRFANNESLYQVREIPPQKDITERVFLIDVSLITWGTPKLVAMACALAFAKHPKLNIKSRFIFIGETFKEYNFTTVDEIADTLGVLGAVISPVQGLTKYLDSTSNFKGVELFLVTTQETFFMLPMQTVFYKYSDRINSIIFTDDLGSIDFYHVLNKRLKQVNQMHLPLDELWAKPKPKVALESSKMAAPKAKPPIINYPLLFPMRQSVDYRFVYEENVYVFTQQGCLFKTWVQNEFRDNEYRSQLLKGFKLIAQDIPKFYGDKQVLIKDGNDFGVLILENDPIEIKFLNTNTKEYSVLQTTETGRYNVYKLPGQETCLMYINGRLNCFKITINNGDIVLDQVMLHEDLTPKSVIRQNLKSNSYVNSIIFSVHFNRMSDLSSALITHDRKLCINSFILDLDFEYSKIRFEQYIGQRSTKINAILKERDDTIICVFPDKSSITFNLNGMLRLESSNSEVPVMYIPYMQKYNLAIATDKEYSGNDFFVSTESQPLLEHISLKDFNNMYLSKFIQVICDYEA